MILELVSSRNKVLTKKAELINFLNPDIDLKSLVTEMSGIIYRNDGLGLAAPQVGISKQLFLIRNFPIQATVINPEILEYSEETELFKEGCLSFPHLFLHVRRPSSIKYRAMNLEGEIIEDSLGGIHARIFQHEYDHLQGEIFTAKVSKFKMDRALKKLAKDIRRSI